jgi:hypothetical protein
VNRIVLVVASVVVAGVARIASAEPAPPPAPANDGGVTASDAAERAKDADRAARAHYDAHEYAAAIVDYHHAFEALPDPLFLFDIAQAHRQLHQCDDALTFYRAYLRARPDADNRVKVEQFIIEMQGCAKSEPTTTDGDRPASGNQPGAADHAQPAIGDDRRVTDNERPKPAAPRKFPSTWQLAGIGTAGVGAVLVGVAVYFSIDGSNDASQLQMACAKGCAGSAVASIDQDGQSANRNAMASYVIGGAALAGGAALFLWATVHAHGEAPIVTPTPGGATVSARMRF